MPDATHSVYTACSYHAAMCARADALRKDGKPEHAHAVEEASRLTFWQILDAARAEERQLEAQHDS